MADADEEIMDAIYRALCEHGYAELTMQRIADHTDKSKATLHYHYDTKEDLLQAFLEHVADWYESEIVVDSADPETRLRSVVSTVFDRAEEDRGEYPTALLEIKAQAPYNEAYRERLRTLDERFRRTVAEAVRDGIDEGVFADADPHGVARFVATATNGGHTREVALGEDPAETRTLVETYLESTLGIDFDGEGET
ncbi:TetR/AcrR family transcriptional regulator [Halosolutus gelatinilyticus]|uniref:TetR/AcrR family transcriptional regulator n=1 Tax=Halosolutus gelatinilyticus TaxID=2931975 RepID=UPI001FF52A02|nr:TetR/AcrR family transcriptional regulator [Halosolutus gelatinilyticus]